MESEQTFSCGSTEQVIVEGAGIAEANGAYTLVGIHNDCGLYTKRGKWYGKNCVFAVFSEQLGLSWFISVLPLGKAKPSDSSGHLPLYFARKTRENAGAHPPLDDWLIPFKFGDVQETSRPPPTVRVKPIDDTFFPGNVIPTVSMMRPVAMAYESMLLSKEHSDVNLVCQDGVVIPAHKNVLAASSSYFKAVFVGPWKENDTGELKIDYPSHNTKAVLKMLYTGVANGDAVKEEPVVFMSIAAEFNLPWLTDIAVAFCLEMIDEDNLKDVWQVARRYDSDVLKDRCVEYAEKNSLTVLVNGTVSNLKAEDPSSWDEFTDRIRKKARLE